MFKSPVLKSGGPPVEYPKTIWTPTGGWYADNVNWKRNTGIVAVGIAALAVYTFAKSISYERRFHPGAIPVPSQSWGAYTLQDDPNYPQKVAEYNRTKKSLYSRIFQTKEDFNEE